MSDDDAQSSFAMEAVNTKNADGEEMTPEEKQDQLVELLAEKRSGTTTHDAHALDDGNTPLKVTAN